MAWSEQGSLRGDDGHGRLLLVGADVWSSSTRKLYAANDPIFSNNSFSCLWPIMRNDMVAMENQLPLVVLQRLLSVLYGTSPHVEQKKVPGEKSFIPV